MTNISEKTNECPVDLNFIRTLLKERGEPETYFVRRLFPKLTSQGLKYYEKLKWNDIKILSTMAQDLGVPISSLLKEHSSGSLCNNGTAGVVGNGNNVGSVSISSDIAAENKRLLMEVNMLKQLLDSKNETIEAKNSELAAIRAQLESSLK